MTSKPDSEPSWGSQSRLVTTEKWKAKSAAMGQPFTDVLVEYARPAVGMQVLDLASGTGEPAISLALRVGGQGHVTGFDLSADLLEIAAQRAPARGLNNFTVAGPGRRALGVCPGGRRTVSPMLERVPADQWPENPCQSACQSMAVFGRRERRVRRVGRVGLGEQVRDWLRREDQDCVDRKDERTGDQVAH